MSDGSDNFIMKTSKQILRDILVHEVKGTTAVSFTYRKDNHRLTKSGRNSLGMATCQKHGDIVGMVGPSYVAKMAKLYGAWNPRPLPWGKWHSLFKVIEHRGELYVRLQWPNKAASDWQRKVWFTDYKGNHIDESLVAQESKTPDHLPVVRSYSFSNIKTIKIKGMVLDLTK